MSKDVAKIRDKIIIIERRLGELLSEHAVMSNALKELVDAAFLPRINELKLELDQLTDKADLLLRCNENTKI